MKIFLRVLGRALHHRIVNPGAVDLHPAKHLMVFLIKRNVLGQDILMVLTGIFLDMIQILRLFLQNGHWGNGCLVLLALVCCTRYGCRFNAVHQRSPVLHQLHRLIKLQHPANVVYQHPHRQAENQKQNPNTPPGPAFFGMITVFSREILTIGRIYTHHVLLFSF